MTITIIGAGYVGLVTAAVFSELGNDVFCVDVDDKKIESLKKGKVPIFEPGLSEYIKRNVQQGRLHFTTSYEDSVPKSKAIFICVGTPPKQTGEADVTYLFSAVEEAAKNFSTDYTLIVIKSTIPIGFEDDLKRAVEKYAKGDFEFASSPEFLREGSALSDTLNPDRVIIGATSKKAQDLLLELHKPLPGQRVICDTRSAQLIKYASNSFLATKISFANAIANICEKTGADVKKVMEGLGLDKRIGKEFLYPGVGYGGSCFPKDVLAFISIADQFDYNFDLLRSVDAINNRQVENFVNKVRKALDASEDQNKDLSNFHFCVYGLAFKPNTDDMRDAPSIKIINKLVDLGAKVTAYDPQAMENAKKILPKIKYADNVYDAAKDKDALLIVTEWPEFIEADYSKIKKTLKRALIVDGRNALDKEKMEKLGFEYIGTGR